MGQSVIRKLIALSPKQMLPEFNVIPSEKREIS